LSEASLLVDGLSVAYGRATETALEGVSVRLEPGGSLGLLGPNGAGKSTLLKAVLGLVPVVGGRILVLGRDPVSARPHVAYVPQADTLDSEFPVSAEQVVLMGRYRRIGWLRRPGRADRRAARAALEQVGLADLADARFGVLSGGQRQRVLLARAIAQEARLLLLDEPFNGVDATSQHALLGALDDLRAHGAAVVLSTHDLGLAHLACSEACLLNRHQHGFGPPSEVLTPDRLHAAYGPQAVALAASSTLIDG
jgi:manganese/iron transport system ATP-binding protein